MQGAGAVRTPMPRCGRAGAPTIVERYDLQRHCLPQLLDLIDDVAAGRRTPPANSAEPGTGGRPGLEGRHIRAAAQRSLIVARTPDSCNRDSDEDEGGFAVIVPVILSGGTGTRLWPLSREGLPEAVLAARLGPDHAAGNRRPGPRRRLRRRRWWSATRRTASWSPSSCARPDRGRPHPAGAGRPQQRPRHRRRRAAAACRGAGQRCSG